MSPSNLPSNTTLIPPIACPHILRLPSSADSFMGLAYPPDGRLVLSYSMTESQIRIWDTHTASMVGSLDGQRDPIIASAATPDRRKLATLSTGQKLRVWDVESRRLIRDFSMIGAGDFYEALAISPEGDKVARPTKVPSVQIWDVDTGEMLMDSTTGDILFQSVISWSRNNDDLLTRSSAGDVAVWRVADGVLNLRAGPFKWDPRCCSAILDGNRLVYGDEAGGITIGSIEDGHFRILRKLRSAASPHLEFSSDGQRFASAGADQMMVIRDTHTGDAIAAPFAGHLGNVSQMVFTLDDKYIASGASGEVRVWDIGAATEQYRLSGIQSETRPPPNESVTSIPTSRLDNTRRRSNASYDSILDVSFCSALCLVH
ncbi:quinon protein alcohol dehydrogenase-like superfamily [Hygrophoropsis aurantiaca]|uniref:Quinon protein alcohol dehydrogenase-like superfamily n=1 Tax=Hygrophoropsis aurantiaca TaxID=72124 RepID=A0ACB7ZZD6_9AGAM|nr:quinon protein alcohol dehydrogenase-like superfamily [Hygrophoropsis aurantiaca]